MSDEGMNRLQTYKKCAKELHFKAVSHSHKYI